MALPNCRKSLTLAAARGRLLPQGHRPSTITHHPQWTVPFSESIMRSYPFGIPRQYLWTIPAGLQALPYQLEASNHGAIRSRRSARSRMPFMLRGPSFTNGRIEGHQDKTKYSSLTYATWYPHFRFLLEMVSRGNCRRL